MKTLLKLASVALPLVALSPLSAPAQIRFGADIHIGDAPEPREVIVDNVPPPPPPREVIVERPYADAIWVPGYYHYHAWVPGYWRHPQYWGRERFERREFRDYDRGEHRGWYRNGRD